MITENKDVEPKLRAYALCDWGDILRRWERLRQPGVEEKAIHVLESSLQLGSPIDVKLAMSWLYLNDIYITQANWERALFYLDQARRFFSERADYAGLLSVLDNERRIYARQGNFRKMFGIEKEMWNTYTATGELSYLRTRIAPWLERMFAGHYVQAEREYRSVIEVAKSLQDQELQAPVTRNLAFCLALQNKSTEAFICAEEGLSIARSLGSGGKVDVYLAFVLYGMTCLECGKLDKAEEYLTQGITLGQQLGAQLDLAPRYLGVVYETLKRYDKAERFYHVSQAGAHRWDRHYHECGALTGLVRVKYAQKDFAAIPPLWTETEQLAQEYEYNDYFTSLYLTRGHLTWDGLILEWESDFDSALRYYHHTLIYALRYNRFLLDEALSGREQGTPLRPIILHCLEHGEEGQRMLIALRDWWQSGINGIGTSRPDTISPIPEGIPLLEAERIARKREPGDGSPQKDVVEQIDTALTMANGGERLSP